MKPTATITKTRTPASITLTLNSVDLQDGWILESNEIGNQGGVLNNNSTFLKIGDNPGREQYRSVLSFITGASLPDSAIITSVTLKVKKWGIVGGGDPVKTFQGFMTDIKNGTFGAAALQAGDFQTQASKMYGPFKPALVGGWYNIDLTSAKDYINKLGTAGGLTQIRLRFRLDDDNNAVANYLSLYSGNAPTASRPQLVITYIP